MVLIGVLARIDASRRQAVWNALEGRSGIQPFELGEQDRIGILMEAEDLDAAHARLTGEIDPMAGVLGTWPVYGDVADPLTAAGAPGPARQGGESK